MLEYIKKHWIRLLSWKASVRENFNKFINSRNKQQDTKRIDTDEESSYTGMGEVPTWDDSFTQVSRHKL